MKKFIVLLKCLFPIIMTILFLLFSISIFSSNLKSNYVKEIGTWLSLCVFSIPCIGFLVITCLCILNKIKAYIANILTAFWIILGLPLTWFIAAIIDKHIYLGVELYL